MEDFLLDEYISKVTENRQQLPPGLVIAHMNQPEIYGYENVPGYEGKFREGRVLFDILETEPFDLGAYMGYRFLAAGDFDRKKISEFTMNACGREMFTENAVLSGIAKAYPYLSKGYSEEQSGEILQTAFNNLGKLQIGNILVADPKLKDFMFGDAAIIISSYKPLGTGHVDGKGVIAGHPTSPQFFSLYSGMECPGWGITQLMGEYFRGFWHLKTPEEFEGMMKDGSRFAGKTLLPDYRALVDPVYRQ